MGQTTDSALDASATGLSLLCLIHCLLLPVLAAFMPLAGVFAEMEWIHKVLVLTALPITVLAIVRHRQSKAVLSFIIPAVLGLALLFAAGFAEELHEIETEITAVGGVLLAGAHIWRWMNQQTPS